jgi:hypothetical protein
MSISGISCKYNFTLHYEFRLKINHNPVSETDISDNSFPVGSTEQHVTFPCFLSSAPAKRSGGYGNTGRLFVSPSVRPRYVDQLISNLHTSIILGISSLNSKLGKIRKKIVRRAAIFKVSANPHQNFKVLQFQRRLIFRRFLTWGMCSHYGSYFQYDRQNT